MNGQVCVEQHHVACRDHDVVRERRLVVLCDSHHHLVGTVLLATCVRLHCFIGHDHRIERRRVPERVAGFRHAFTDLLDPACGLVAHDLAAHTPAVLAGGVVDVRPTDAGAGNAQNDLPGSGLRLVHVVDIHSIEVLEDECFHP